MIRIAGAGLAGCTLARVLAEKGKQCTVFESKSVVGGLCADMLQGGNYTQLYGPHIFHTNHDIVWDFLSDFTGWIPYEHRVFSKVGERYIEVPITEEDVLKNNDTVPYEFPQSSMEVCLSRFGMSATLGLMEPYSKKQWGKSLFDIPSEVCARLHPRKSRLNGYFTDKYQGIPDLGFTQLCMNLLQHPNITLLLNSGMIEDEVDFFSGDIGGEYRTVVFKFSQGALPYPVVNYPDKNTPYLRRSMPLQFINPKRKDGVVCTETFLDRGGVRAYPIGEFTSSYKDTVFLGRLGTHRYLNMDTVVKEAMEIANENS